MACNGGMRWRKEDGWGEVSVKGGVRCWGAVLGCGTCEQGALLRGVEVLGCGVGVRYLPAGRSVAWPAPGAGRAAAGRRGCGCWRWGGARRPGPAQGGGRPAGTRCSQTSPSEPRPAASSGWPGAPPPAAPTASEEPGGAEGDPPIWMSAL